MYIMFSGFTDAISNIVACCADYTKFHIYIYIYILTDKMKRLAKNTYFLDLCSQYSFKDVQLQSVLKFKNFSSPKTLVLLVCTIVKPVTHDMIVCLEIEQGAYIIRVV